MAQFPPALRATRTTQPQGPAQVSADIPTPSMVWVASNPKAPIKRAGSGFPEQYDTVYTPTPKGVAVSFATALAGRVILTDKADNVLSTDGFTAVIVMSRSGAAQASFAFSNGSFNTTAYRCSAHLPYSDGVTYFDFGGISAPNRLSVAGVVYSTVRDVFVLTAGAAGMRIFQNGVLIASSSTAVSRPNPAGCYFGIGLSTATTDTIIPMPDTGASYAAQISGPCSSRMRWLCG